MTEVALQSIRLSTWEIIKLAPYVIPLYHIKIYTGYIKDLNVKGTF